MKNFVKYIFIFAFVLTITLLTSDNNVYADTFNEDFGVVSQDNTYSIFIEWSNPNNDFFQSIHTHGTKKPYINISSLNNTAPVYAFLISYMPFPDVSYYYSGIYFVSKSDFSITANNCTWRRDYTISNSSVYSNNGLFYCYVPLSDYCDRYNNSGLGGATDIIKGDNLQVYEIRFDEYFEVPNYFFENKIEDFIKNGSDDDVNQSNEDESISHDRENATFDSNIGALKNLRIDTVFLRGDNYSVDTDSYKRIFSYDSKTTTGFSVKSTNNYIQYGFRFSGYQSAVRGGPKEDLKNYVSDYYYDNECTDTRTEILGSLETLMLQKYFDNSPLIYKSNYGQYYHEEIYLRLCYKDDEGKCHYGTWVRYNIQDGEDSTDDTVDEGDTDDGGIPEDGEYDDPHSSESADNSSGWGDDYDDAEDNSNENRDDRNNGGSVSFDSVKDLLNKIGNVPAFIGTLFSFLPSWCLNLVGAAFAMFVILMIVKIVRG